MPAGWQRQLNAMSVQEALETSARKFCGEKITIIGAGRTDAGVHAIGQVANFHTSKLFEPYKLISAFNYYLKPLPIVVTEASIVDKDFHARFSAKARHYCYRLYYGPVCPVFDYGSVWHCPYKLDIEAMIVAAQMLLGTHDFTSFRAARCQARNPVITLTQLDIITPREKEINFMISARSFLHHMVRNIVGTLVAVGCHRWPPEHVLSMLEAKDRAKAGMTAPPEGLYLTKVDY